MKRNAFLAAVVLAGVAAVVGRAGAQAAARDEPSDVLGEVRASAREWVAHPDGVTAMAFDGTGHRLATAGGEGAIKVWDLSGGLLAQAPSRGRRIFGLLWSPDGKYLLSLEAPAKIVDPGTASAPTVVKGYWHEDNSIAVWDAGSGALASEWATPRQSLLAARFASDGALIVSGSTSPLDANGYSGQPEPFVQWRSFPEGKVQRQEPIEAQAIGPDGEKFAGLVRSPYYAHQTIEVWTRRGSTFQPISIRTASVKSLAFSPDGKYLLASTIGAGEIKMWEARSGRFVRHAAVALDSPYDTMHMALGGRWGLRAGVKSALWDLETGTYQGALGQGGEDDAAAMSADGKRGALATLARAGTRVGKGGREGVVRLYDLSQIQPPDRFPAWRDTTQGRLSDGLPLNGATMVGLGAQADGDIAAVALRTAPIYSSAEGQLLRWSLSRSALLEAFDLHGPSTSPSSPMARPVAPEDDEPSRLTSERLPLALADDGSLVAVETVSDHLLTVEIHDAARPTSPGVLLRDSGEVMLIGPAFTPGSRFFVAWRWSERGWELVRWDVKSGQATVLLSGQTADFLNSSPGRRPTSAYAVSPDGTQVAISSDFPPSIRLFHLSQRPASAREESVALELGDNAADVEVPSMAWSPDSQVLAVGTTLLSRTWGAFEQHRVALWDAVAHRFARRLWAASAPISLRWSRDATLLVAGCASQSVWRDGGQRVETGRGGQVRAWDVRRPLELSGTTRAALPVGPSVVDVALEGSTVLFAPQGERPRLWDFAPRGAIDARQ